MLRRAVHRARQRTNRHQLREFPSLPQLQLRALMTVPCVRLPPDVSWLRPVTLMQMHPAVVQTLAGWKNRLLVHSLPVT